MEFLLAVSLSMDAFAAAVSCGILTPGFGRVHAVMLGLYFGFFQSAMAILGYHTGRHFSYYASFLGNLIAFILLTVIGGKMIWEALHHGPEEVSLPSLTHSRMLLLAVATSIDSLAAGVSLAFWPIDIECTCAMIGIVAFLFSVSGGLFGQKLSGAFQHRAEFLGGLVLISLGIKSLFQL